MKQIERLEVKVVAIESVDICTASAVTVETTGVTMSKTKGYVVTGTSFE